ncbi:hypothetical protein ACFQAQ_04325 [Novosphingobium resinovorum]|uniref:hypothetical protein n=1 Tax=Novosphingobium resinovorum TaxID=158500 RepID=UPI003610A3E5
MPEKPANFLPLPPRHAASRDDGAISIEAPAPCCQQADYRLNIRGQAGKGIAPACTGQGQRGQSIERGIVVMRSAEPAGRQHFHRHSQGPRKNYPFIVAMRDEPSRSRQDRPGIDIFAPLFIDELA